ncbi:MAG: nitrilase-related carbon-nitrogen hydrolase [Chloroflexota bacterium]
MKIPKNLSMRQTLEGMTLTFNPEAARGMNITIQFDMSGSEPGVYHLAIANGECSFHVGAAQDPTLTILAPSDVWLKISRGEMTGYDALMQELYTATGEITLLMQMDSLFHKASEVTYEAPASQRPAGPISLPGMAWMTVAFLPWILHWSTFDIPKVSHWVSVGVPLLLSALIVAYRFIFSRPNSQSPTFMEWGGLAYFTISALLALTGAPGYAEWGSVVSGFGMAGLWLGSLVLREMPLSGDYSKWGFIKPLWRNSMFIYPNAVISLVWGWQFIAAATLGIAAILLPEQKLLLTLARHLLLIPAFLFTSEYQKRVPISNPRLSDAQIRFWAGMGLSAISGFLLTASMPGFDVPFIGWIALVPLLVILLTAESKHVYPLALPFGMVFSIGVHNWYPNIFPPALGYFLIFAVGTYYAGVLQLGAWLYSRLPAPLKVLGLPVAWSAIEFIKYIAPVVEDWWFVLLADSAWRFPAALQVLSITGVFGLSFVVMWVNAAIATLLMKDSGMSRRASLIALGLSALVIGAGALSIRPAENGFKVAVLTDMVNQDPLVLAQGEFAGTRVTSPEVSQAIFDTDAALARSIALEDPAFIVFPENEFADADDPQFMNQLGALAQETNAYLAADTLWQTPSGLHDTALLVSPDGAEAARRAKINITSGEADAGIVAGPPEFSSTPTPYGNVGISVCWDVHRLWIIRELARSGAQIILLPMDNDFNGIATFPPFHAADAVFRAAENRLAFGLGTVNGLSMAIDPYGRITAEGKVNERGVTVGETFVVDGSTLYTRFGDWFGWTMVAMTIGLILTSLFKK